LVSGGSNNSADALSQVTHLSSGSIMVIMGN
jgi:hypothetical protein